MAETFGSGLGTKITDQLKARTKLFSERKDPKQLQAINSNVAWIKVRSSVNVKGDNQPAKEFILSNSGNKEGIQHSSSTATNPLYKQDKRLGYRPAPGITAFKVTSKNTYGTLQEATVNFNVWTLEDLEAAEQLYFRPGYSVLVEWGHSAYIDNKSNIQFTNETAILDDSKWFQSSTYETIEKLIKKKRENYDGNYEGFLGLIINFSWSYRTDGGYDCSIKVVSKNVVLESITIPPGKASELSDNSDTGQSTDEVFRTVYHTYFDYIRRYSTKAKIQGGRTVQGVFGSTTYTPFGNVLNKTTFNLHSALTPEKLQSKLTNSIIYRAVEQKTSGIDENLDFIPLKLVLEIYNKEIALQNENQILIPFDIESQEGYYTFNELFSCLPYDVLLLKKPSPKKNTLKELYKFEDYYVKAFDNLDGNKILDIHVSTKMVLEELEAVVNGPQEEGVAYLDALKGILRRTQRGLGNIHDFDIILDQFNTKLRIVDRKTVLNDTENLTYIKNNPLKLTGLGSTLVDLSINSAITSNLASQVAIAAQSPFGKSKSGLGPLFRWNKDLIDRHFKSKSNNKIPLVSGSIILQPETPYQITSEEERLRSQTQDNLQQIKFRQVNTEPIELKIIPPAEVKAKEISQRLNILWGDINSDGVNTVDPTSKRPYASEVWNNIYNYLSELLGDLAEFPIETSTETVKGVVPVELSFKMLGLGGFKVGTTFTIEKGILPNKYNDFGYIITGVEQEIGSDNKWYTSIKTQFFVIKN